MSAGHVPDVSVVVPCFDAMPYLPTCLDSLVAQSIERRRMQVVVVDDGSRDGSAELLDRYAAAHPDWLEVHHQENSGGPAGPCNVGLGLATGRYVFFLGADDHLGPEALERMVERADAWGSDVLCVKMVGLNGRWVSQALFDADHPDVPFPSEPLAWILSNTKLFRRDLLERHAIRFRPDLRVGSDQPFTVEAMSVASRVSVAADYDYYFAVRREDSSNLTYVSTWRHRLDAMDAVVRHLAPLLEEGAARDAILQRHFRHEVARLLRWDYPELPEDDRRELRAGVSRLAADHLGPAVLARVGVPVRLRYLLAQADRDDALLATRGLEERPTVVEADGDDLFWVLPPELDLDRASRRLGGERPAVVLDGFVTAARVRRRGEVLALELQALLARDSRPRFRVALVRAPQGRSRDPVRLGDRARPVVEAPLSWDGELLRAEVELGGLPPGQCYAVRVLVPMGGGTASVPVPSTDRPGSEREGLEQDPAGRLLVRVDGPRADEVEGSRAGARRLVGRLRRTLRG